MRLRRHLFIAAILALSLCTVYAAEKERDWKTGKVLDSERSRYFAGTVGNASTNGSLNNSGGYYGNTSTSETAVYRVYQNFVIEGDQFAYLTQERLRWRWSKPADLTVNGTVKYAAEKRKLYVIDDDGKQHEMEVVKKTMRLPDSATK